MAKKSVFISCGQRTQPEKELGGQILSLINSHGMVGFFAEEAHEPADLNAVLFRELQRCDGFVAVMQNRGEVRFGDFPVTCRASVWIQQEVAILFYRSFLLGRAVPIRVFTERDLLREGLIAVSIINPIPFDDNAMLLSDLAKWLKGPAFEEEPVLVRRESAFKNRIRQLDDIDWLLLELIAVHSPEPGGFAPVVQVAKDFEALCPEAKTRDTYTKNRLGRLESTGLVTSTAERAQNIRINKPWWNLVIEEMKNQGRSI